MGFFYFYSGRFCGEVECCIACRIPRVEFLMSSSVNDSSESSSPGESGSVSESEYSGSRGRSSEASKLSTSDSSSQETILPVSGLDPNKSLVAEGV